METPLLKVIITASVTLLGWVVNHILAERRDRANHRLASSLRFVERQLEELYGPLAFLILKGAEPRRISWRRSVVSQYLRERML